MCSKMYEIKDKVFFVTGGSAGIGAGVVRAFLEGGAKHVAVLDVDVNNGKALEKEMTARLGPNKIKFYKCDVTSDELNEAYDDVLKTFGYIDVVINNAGIMNDKLNVIEKEIAINVTALVASSLKAFNLMRVDHGGKGGTIINISSIVGLLQGTLLPVYGATKSAVLQFSNALGKPPHDARSGVRVITLCFGCTRTALFNEARMGSIDQETEDELFKSLNILPWQKAESAVKGLVEAYQQGSSGSTWLVTSGTPAKDITANVTKAYEIMSEGVFEPSVDFPKVNGNLN